MRERSLDSPPGGERRERIKPPLLHMVHVSPGMDRGDIGL